MMVKSRIESRFNIRVDLASTFARAVELVGKEKRLYFLAILDLTLPDASADEVVDYALIQDIPSIVFAGRFSNKLRDNLWTKMIIDYVLKENPNSIEVLLSLVDRICKNPAIDVLVVDDSKASRLEICNLLTIHRYNVFYAENGSEALQILQETPDIKLLIVDYHMPEMNGLQLVKKVRLTFPKNELAIIGISSYGNSTISAQFIKNGANDFLTKPFSSEELYCRVNQNIELIEYIQQIRESSYKDYLTGLYNRRYLFETGGKLLASAHRRHIAVTVAMVDIDFFKQVNDTYGHDAGDMVLKNLGDVFNRRFRQTDIVCRYGGEEICILGVNMEQESIMRIFDDLRRQLANTSIDIGEQLINITVSIGVCTILQERLEDMLSIADEHLYTAKETGRNKVVVQDFSE